MKNFNIAFFASHSGSNMQAIINQIEIGKLKSNPCMIISNNSNSGACERAENHKIPFYHISTKTHPNDLEREKYIEFLFEHHNINLVVLAGYMKKLPDAIIKKVNNMVLNIHPALLPKYGGEGMYGMNVHKAVIENKELFSGATVHQVNSEYDEGNILMQAVVPVYANDTPEKLAERVLKIEHIIFPLTIELLESEQIRL